MNATTITITIDENNVVHSTIKCGEQQNFERVKDCLMAAREELNIQLNNQLKCPFNPVNKIKK